MRRVHQRLENQDGTLSWMSGNRKSRLWPAVPEVQREQEDPDTEHLYPMQRNGVVLAVKGFTKTKGDNFDEKQDASSD